MSMIGEGSGIKLNCISHTLEGSEALLVCYHMPGQHYSVCRTMSLPWEGGGRAEIGGASGGGRIIFFLWGMLESWKRTKYYS